MQQPIQSLHHPQSHLCNSRRISPQTSRPKGKQSSADIICSYQQGRADPTQRLGRLIKRVSPLPCANRLSVAEQQTQSRAWCCSLSTGKPSRTTGGTAWSSTPKRSAASSGRRCVRELKIPGVGRATAALTPGLIPRIISPTPWWARVSCLLDGDRGCYQCR